MNTSRIIPNPYKNTCESGVFHFHAEHIMRDYKINDPHIDEAHIHPFYEIYVNLSGNVSFLYHQSMTKIQPGDIIFSYPGTFHHCIYHEPGFHEHYCIWFQLDSSTIEEYLRKSVQEGFIRLNLSFQENLFTCLSRLSKLSEVDGKHFEKTSVFLELLNLISTGEQTSEYEEIPDFPEKFHEMLEFVNNNYTNIHDVKEIATTCHISTATMNRLFRQYLQLSPHQLLTSKRMSYAEKLLQTGHTVTESCFQAGFSDCSHFISAFKKAYGQTPYQYKKQFYS